MITFESSGSLNNFESFLETMSKKDSITKGLEKFAIQGVAALAAATPVESGLTADAWDYEIVNGNGSYSIYWTNSHVVAGVPVVILLQYGHGTGTGGYVEGVDFINPALKPIFDKISDEVWKVVTNA